MMQVFAADGVTGDIALRHLVVALNAGSGPVVTLDPDTMGKSTPSHAFWRHP